MAKHKTAHGHAVQENLNLARTTALAAAKTIRDGMRLEFSLDEAARQAICHFNLSRRYTGPPGHAHGGIIATILDEAMGKVNKFRNVLALTSSMEIKYFKPVPLGQPLTVTGYEQSVEGRKHINIAEISNDKDEVLARSTGTFIAIDPEKMFAQPSQPGELAARRTGPEKRDKLFGRNPAKRVK